MKTQTLKLLASLTLFCSCAASLPNVASAQPAVAPIAPAPASLEIQISAPERNGKRFLALDPVQPHFSVILRNTSEKPLQLFEEWNSLGYYNLHLEITAVDGKSLTKPLLIKKGMNAWARNFASTETLAPNEAVVREVYLHMPAEIKNPDALTPDEEKEKDIFLIGTDYRFFPFPKKSETNTVTMKAVYEEESKRPPLGVWTGRIESAPLTYEIHWTAPRR